MVALLSKLPKYYHFFGFHLEALDSALNSIEPDNQTAFTLLQSISKDYNFYSRNPFGSQMKGEKPVIAPVVYTQPEPPKPAALNQPANSAKAANSLNLAGMKMVSKPVVAPKKPTEDLIDFVDLTGPSGSTQNHSTSAQGNEDLLSLTNQPGPARNVAQNTSISQKTQSKNDDHLLNFSIGNPHTASGPVGSASTRSEPPMRNGTGLTGAGYSMGGGANNGMYSGTNQGGYQLGGAIKYGGYSGGNASEHHQYNVGANTGGNLVDMIGGMSLNGSSSTQIQPKLPVAEDNKKDAFDFLDL